MDSKPSNYPGAGPGDAVNGGPVAGTSDVIGGAGTSDVLEPGRATQPGGMGSGAGTAPAQGMIPSPRGSVRDIMTPDPVGVYFEQTIGETARIMRDAQVGVVFVVNGETLSGVVTDRDLVIRGLAEGAGPDSPVGPLCSSRLVGVAADAEIGQAEELIRENAVRRLPVIEDGQVIGIVSLGDLAVTTQAESPLAAVSRAQPNS